MTETIVRDIAFANIQRSESGAVAGQGEDAGISDGGTASGVEIAEFVAMGDQVSQTCVRHALTFGHRQISAKMIKSKHFLWQSMMLLPERRSKLGQFT